MPPTTPHTPRTTQSLLLLEQDPRTLRMLEVCLERMGYRVLTSSSADRTQELLGTTDIDLLVASLPKDEEGEHLALLESALGNHPILLVQAGMDCADTDAHPLQGCSSVHLLERPFTMDELDRSIRDALRPRVM